MTPKEGSETMRFFHPYLVFLSEDPSEAARFSNNALLLENLKQTRQVLVCVLLHIVGIRSKKIHKFLFSKERKDDTLRKYFKGWPSKSAPQFTLYNSPEAKWARMCKNRYDYLVSFLEANQDEFFYRFGKDCPAYEYLDFFKMAVYDIAFNNLVALPDIPNLRLELPWKNLPLDCRKKNVVEGYRKWYLKRLGDPISEYVGTKRDVPEFVMLGRESLA